MLHSVSVGSRIGFLVHSDSEPVRSSSVGLETPPDVRPSHEESLSNFHYRQVSRCTANFISSACGLLLEACLPSSRHILLARIDSYTACCIDLLVSAFKWECIALINLNTCMDTIQLGSRCYDVVSQTLI
jgi:hypothetical protein